MYVGLPPDSRIVPSYFTSRQCCYFPSFLSFVSCTPHAGFHLGAFCVLLYFAFERDDVPSPGLLVLYVFPAACLVRVVLFNFFLLRSLLAQLFVLKLVFFVRVRVFYTWPICQPRWHGGGSGKASTGNFSDDATCATDNITSAKVRNAFLIF